MGCSGLFPFPGYVNSPTIEDLIPFLDRALSSRQVMNNVTSLKIWEGILPISGIPFTSAIPDMLFANEAKLYNNIVNKP